jgi:hypothetical protein
MERESTEPEHIIFSRIHFIMDIFGTWGEIYEGKYEPISFKATF